MQVCDKYSILFVSLFIVLAACTPTVDELEIPADIISRDSMVQLITEVHLAEARLMVTNAGNTAHLARSAYMHAVLTKMHTDTARFRRSFDYYTAHPALFSAVYEEVISEVSRRQAESKK